MIRKIIAENAIYRSDAITGTFLKNGYDEMGLPWSNVYISFCGDKKKTKIAGFAIHESSCKQNPDKFFNLNSYFNPPKI